MKDRHKEEQWLLEEKYGGKKTKGFFADMKRLKAGEPLAYIIGYTPFQNVTIYLDNHPLIPRVETEYWVAEVAKKINKTKHDNLRFLDLCAGSGCIGVSLLDTFPKAHADFAEIDTRLHSTILKNVTENFIEEKRCAIYGGDLLTDITDIYDYIFTNPPYIDPAHNKAEKSVRMYEPHSALYGGADGLEYIIRIISDAPRYLTPGGMLYIEHEPEQTRMIAHIGQHQGFLVETNTDQYGVERYTGLTRRDH